MTKVGDVVILLLITGQELMAEITSTGGGDYYDLMNITQVGFMAPRPGMDPSHPMVGIGPWIPYRDTSEPVTIFREHVITTMVPTPELLQNYKKQFSKVITPTSLIIPSR
jgi:hypothetical protein